MMNFLPTGRQGALLCALAALALPSLSLAAANGKTGSESAQAVVSGEAEAGAPASSEASPAASPTGGNSSKAQATEKKPGVVGTALKPVKAVAGAAWEPVKAAAGATWTPMKQAGAAIGKGSAFVGNALREEVLRMHEFFDVTLPGIAARHHLILDFEPKVGDLVRREFVRFPLQARYGVNSRLELLGGLTPVAPNPFDDGVDHRWSLGMANLGFRYNLPADTLLFKTLILGFEARQPLGNPPFDLIDGYMHLRPSITTSRPMPWMKDTTLFVALLYDHSVNAPGHDAVLPDVVKRHMIELAPGLLYKPGQFGYFGQYAIRYWDEPIGYRLEHLMKVGVLWDMPLERSQKLRLPGKWQVELGYKVSHLDGEELVHGVHARVKVRTDFFRRRKSGTVPAP